MLLSIIIPTYNCPAYLETTLRHLCSDLPGGIEAIVVDDGSADETTESIEACYLPIVCLKTDKRSGPGLARNAGVRVARGQYFVPLDSDCCIDLENLHWLTKFPPTAEEKTYLFTCVSWPQNHRSVVGPRKRPYPSKEILLRRYGEVVSVFPTGVGSPDLARTHLWSLMRGSNKVAILFLLVNYLPHWIVQFLFAWVRGIQETARESS